MQRFKVRTVHGAFSQIAGRAEELVNQKEFEGYALSYIYEIDLTGDAHALLMVFEAVDYIDEIIPVIENENTDETVEPVDEEDSETEDDE